MASLLHRHVTPLLFATRHEPAPTEASDLEGDPFLVSGYTPGTIFSWRTSNLLRPPLRTSSSWLFSLQPWPQPQSLGIGIHGRGGHHSHLRIGDPSNSERFSSQRPVFKSSGSSSHHLPSTAQQLALPSMPSSHVPRESLTRVSSSFIRLPSSPVDRVVCPAGWSRPSGRQFLEPTILPATIFEDWATLSPSLGVKNPHSFLRNGF